MMCCTCGEAPAYSGFDDCLACAVAYMIHESPSDIESTRRIFAGDAWLRDFDREVERQMSALVHLSRACA